MSNGVNIVQYTACYIIVIQEVWNLGSTITWDDDRERLFKHKFREHCEQWLDSTIW